MSFTEDPGPARDPIAESVHGHPPNEAAPAQQAPAEPAAAEPTAPAAGPGAAESPAEPQSAAPPRDRGSNMLPERESRRFRVERLLVRFIATLGIVGIGVALGAILVSSKTQGWVTGLVVAIVSVVLSAILWSSKQM